MILIQEGYECEFEMNIFINIFFEKSEEGRIFQKFSHENDKIRVYTRIDFQDEVYEADYSCDFLNDVTDKKTIKKCIAVHVQSLFVTVQKK